MAQRVTQRPGNLPAEMTSFVGRRAELADIRRQLRLSRMVTLVGPGGVGKSRLALRAAGDGTREYPDGVFLVEVASVLDGDVLPHAIAGALGLRDHSARPMIDVLSDYLRDMRLLLVLDTCERHLSTCAKLAMTLLPAAEGLRILATSRQPLGLMEERTVVVPPLAVVEDDQPRGAQTTDDAVALFAERAAAAAAFELTPHNEAAAIKLCRRLDGIPLAIELAAVRLRALSIDQIQARLDRRFALLSAGSRTAPARHRTLYAAIDWSHQLCSAEEQLLWARMSVFPEEFDASAAATVCCDERLAPRLVPALLDSLVEKSIVLRRATVLGGRYRLLDTLRDYGLERLGLRGDQDWLRRRHRDYYLDLVRRIERDWFGPVQPLLFAQARGEMANLRAAIEHSLTTPGEAEAGLELAASISIFWPTPGEGRAVVERALGANPARSALRTKALWAGGSVAILQGDPHGARKLLEQCLAEAPTTAPEWLPYAQQKLGVLALVGDDPAHSLALIQQANEQFTKLNRVDDQVILARAQMAMALLFRDEVELAEAYCHEAEAVCRTRGEQWALSYVLYVHAQALWRKGDRAGAARIARECLELKYAFRDLPGVAIGIELLAMITAADGQHKRAAKLWGAAVPIWRATGERFFGSRVWGDPHLRHETETREALGADAFETARRNGTRLTVDQAVAYALGPSTAGTPGTAGRAGTAGTATPDGAGTVRTTTLTRRELEVAGMIAKGLSNREIAARLVVSIRTVESHVDHMLRKLGVTSRAAVAAWAAAQSRENGSGTSRTPPAAG